MRRRSNRSTWVTRWNQHRGFKPFLFKQTCSCLTGGGAAGCHVPTFVGTTEDVKLQGCNSVPSTDITVQSAKEGLCSLLKHFCPQIGHCDPLQISGAALGPRGVDSGDGYDHPQSEGATVSSRLSNGQVARGPPGQQTNLFSDHEATRGPPHDKEDRKHQEAISYPTDAKEREKEQ